MYEDELEQRYRFKQLELKEEYQRHLLNVANRDAQFRTILAFILTVGLFAVVGAGVFSQTTASNLSPLVAPLAGLTGIAIGYYFGQGAAMPRFDDDSPRPLYRAADRAAGSGSVTDESDATT